MSDDEAPIYADKEALEQAVCERDKEANNQPRLKDSFLYLNGYNLLLEELQRQQIRVSQTIQYLQRQNQLLDVFKKETLYKLGQNTKAVIRQQLGEANREALRDLREIKNLNTNIVEMLLSQERRMSKIQAALESIRAAVSGV